jgi:Icc-related predicted phosphoesterase
VLSAKNPNIEIIKPKIHVCGHIHSAHGEHHDGKTHFINASTLNERYQVQYKPIVYTIDLNDE